MNLFFSCNEGLENCMKTKRFSISHLFTEEKTHKIHIHDCYEIYYSISGGKQFFIDNQYYNVSPGDLFVINQYESHYITALNKNAHERINIAVHPEFLSSISTEQTQLDSCFTFRPQNVSHRIPLDCINQQRLIYYIHKITCTSGYGSDIIENAAFSELLAMINYQFMYKHQEQLSIPSPRSHNQIAINILEYVNKNITKDVSVRALAKVFYISESYVCRIFKNYTGTTINKYVTARRISIAKALLAEGKNVSEVYGSVGFNDYSSFLKAFVKLVGVSPKKYSKFN